MNDRSTRAHSLFILTLKQTRPGTSVTLRSRLYLADLGGSEQVKKSGVEAGFLREGGTDQFSLGFEMGDHMREAVNINLGLLALKKCIEGEHHVIRLDYFPALRLCRLLSRGISVLHVSRAVVLNRHHRCCAVLFVYVILKYILFLISSFPARFSQR
jgi:hypothetical protein